MVVLNLTADAEHYVGDGGEHGHRVVLRCNGVLLWRSEPTSVLLNNEYDTAAITEIVAEKLVEVFR